MSVRQVALSDLAGDAALKNSFVITSDGAPGDVVSNLIILGGEGMQPVQLLGKDSQVSNGGGHPWNIDQGDRATVFLFNRSSKEEVFNVNIVANGARWHQEYTLKPAETKSIDIYKIVADQEADKKGKKLPANATSGEVSWFTVDPGKGSGRVLVSNAQSGLARNFSCGYNLVLCGSFLYNSVATFGIGDDGYLGDISDYTCTAYANNACSGQQYDSGNGGYSYSWSSGSPGIAPTTGSTTNSSGEFYGQAGGTGTGTGQLNSQYCQSQSSGQNNIQVPTSLQGPTISPQQTYSNQNLYDCNGNLQTGNFYGISSCGQYNVLDQNNQQIIQPGLAFDEKLSLSDYNSNYATPPASKTGSGASDANYHLIDFYSNGGIGSALPADYYTYYAQTITYHPTGATVRVNCITDLPTQISVANMTANPSYPCHH